MARKSVLITAIEKLKEANSRIFEKSCKVSDEKLKEKLREDITRNNAMILDYQFRLEND